MRLLRLLAMGAVLLVLVGGALGTACAGAKGEQGPRGETGATGTTGDTGPRGPQGVQGPQGMQGLKGDKGEQGGAGLPGVQGPAGPSKILAMGAISDNGTIDYGYNVENCTSDNTFACYEIALTGFYYTDNNFITMVTPTWTLYGGVGCLAGSNGTLLVYIYDGNWTSIQSWFSFMVLAKPWTTPAPDSWARTCKQVSELGNATTGRCSA